MSAKVTDIKNAIDTILGTLVTATTLGSKVTDDFRKGILDREYGSFPVAILTTPAIDSRVYDTIDTYRTHKFEIVILMKAENVTSATQVEDLMEAVLNAFDNKPTLSGTAQETDAAVSAPAPIVSRGGTYIGFSVMISAKALYQRSTP